MNRLTLPLIIALLCVGLGACVSVSGRAEIDEQGNPKAVTFKVTRVMSDTQMEGLEIQRGDNGFRLNLTGYKSESEKLAESIAEGVTRGIGP